MANSPDPSPEDGFRWQSWLQRSDEAVFLLNRRRRLVFANRAWEQATGLLLKEVRGHVCRRRPRGVLADKTESILGALAPPAEVWKGSPSQSRRLLPIIGRPARWVEMAYLPLGGGATLLGVVGVIKPLPEAPRTPTQPIPEKWLALRDRHAFPLSLWEGDAPALVRLVSQIRLAAGQPGLPLSIFGAKGTGKHSVARAVHQLSACRQRFFACLDCARLPPDGIAEVLMGEERDGKPPLGVVLLKEPARLPREVQSRIVDLLDRRDDQSPWILAAFREDPINDVRAGVLMEALHARLTTLIVTLPTLQERRDSLPRLAHAILDRLSPLFEKGTAGIAQEAMEFLRHHAWPGNLHELHQVIQGAAERAEGARIEPTHLPLYLRARPALVERTFNLDSILEKVERRMLELALRLADGNKKKASDLLGIWRARLLRRVEALGINAPNRESPE